MVGTERSFSLHIWTILVQTGITFTNTTFEMSCEFPLNMTDSFAFLNHHTHSLGRYLLTLEISGCCETVFLGLLEAFWSSWGSIPGINLSHPVIIIVGFYLHFKLSFDLQAIFLSKNILNLKVWNWWQVFFSKLETSGPFIFTQIISANCAIWV